MMNPKEENKQNSRTAKETPVRYAPEWKVSAAELETELLAQVCGGTGLNAEGRGAEQAITRGQKPE